MLINESRLIEIIREEVEQFTSKEMGVDTEPSERKAGKWWQSSRKRREFAESYTSGKNKEALINTIKSKAFKPGTPNNIIYDYYDEFILPQVLHAIHETWVVIDDKKTKSRATRYSPSDRPEGKAGRIIKTKDWMFLLPGLAAGILTGQVLAALVGSGPLVANAVRWRRYVFGHEVSHAIDREVDLVLGFRWESGYQNPRSIYTKSTEPVDNPKYLPYKNEKALFPNLGSVVSHQREILRGIFPCINEDHPEYKDEHEYRPGELYANVIQWRKKNQRDFKASDIKKWRRLPKIRSTLDSTIADLILIIKACGNKPDQEIADALNKLG